MSDLTLPVLYLRQFAEQLRAMSKSADAWLEDCGLDARQLELADFQPDFPLFCRLIERALEIADTPALGLLVGERLQVGTHGILGFAALQSASLRQSLALLERYLALRTTLVDLLHDHDEPAGLECLKLQPRYPLGSIQRCVLEAVTLAIKNVLDAATQGNARPERVCFNFPAPPYASLAAELFACPVAYDHPWTGFIFSTTELDQPLRLADPEAFRQAELICQRELQRLGDTTSMSARVRRLMLEKQQGFPSLNMAARLFHLTPRTLHRRLLAEGTSFKQILEDVRHTLAIEQLKAGQVTVEAIAYSLGYTDLANFRRAFRRWEGVPPAIYRERWRASTAE